MTPNPLIELADRVQALTCACRETDGDIAAALALYPTGWRRGVKEAAATAIWFNDKTGQSWSAPAYTASLDAAMTLVPEGALFSVGHVGDEHPLLFQATVMPMGPSKHGLANSPALALTAASLRARAASENSHGR